MSQSTCWQAIGLDAQPSQRLHRPKPARPSPPVARAVEAAAAAAMEKAGSMETSLKQASLGALPEEAAEGVDMPAEPDGGASAVVLWSHNASTGAEEAAGNRTGPCLIDAAAASAVRGVPLQM